MTIRRTQEPTFEMAIDNFRLELKHLQMIADSKYIVNDTKTGNILQKIPGENGRKKAEYHFFRWRKIPFFTFCPNSPDIF
jgi:hypothetical protein